MRKLMMVVAMSLVGAALFAAQCEGLTQKGERCKRDAAEGSKFCIGHADQAKKVEKAEPKAKAEGKKAEPKANAEIKKTEPKAKAETKKPEPKETAVPKEKDDDTCWAVTEAGTRCKHKRDGDSDYCKQHSPDVKPAKPVEQCRAMTYEGKQCIRKPVENNRYCKQHGGK